MTLLGSAKLGTFQEFKSHYQPGDAQRRFSGGSTLLSEALGNPVTANRSEIANFLLDEGADPLWQRTDGTNLLHILLSKIDKHGLGELDVRLFRRLLETGVNVNASAKRFGTPLQVLRRYAAQGEVNVIPVYDVLFARDDLDLFSPGKYGHSTYSSAWKTRESKPVLWRRVQQYVVDHGLQVPESERVEES